jgi:hypothetical protein
MSDLVPFHSNVVFLFDPSDKHGTLDEDDYPIFWRFRIFADIRQLLNTGQYGHIDLHVPTTFTFDDIRPYPKVYIHTYFMDDDESSYINDVEREKIRDSIRTCCEDEGVEYAERGVMEDNSYYYDESIGFAGRLYQMDVDRRDRLLE